MKSLGAFIITYRRPDVLKETLRLILEQTHVPDLILVVDNGKSKETETVVRDFQSAKLFYHSAEQNLGPAGAAAYGIQWLCDQQCEWIYWVDDDDPPQFPDTLYRLGKLVLRAADHERLAGVATVGSKFDWMTGELRRLPNEALKGVIEVDAIGGNQQLILRRSAIQAVGLPDARLFFGLEEIEYCLRFRRAGYTLLVDGAFMQEHRKKAGRWELKIKRTPVPRYSYSAIWRRYYTTRNYIFVMRKTFQSPHLARREAVKSLIRIVASWRHGVRYGSAFTRLQLQGLVDGYRSRMGLTVRPYDGRITS
jgi:GT2 family glycosyltransferase